MKLSFYYILYNLGFIMTTFEEISITTIELATYEPRNKLLAIYIKLILNGLFFWDIVSVRHGIPRPIWALSFNLIVWPTGPIPLSEAGPEACWSHGPKPYTSMLNSEPIGHAILLCISHSSLPETYLADTSWSGTLLLKDAVS